jgi:hypothetical protein
MSYHLAVPNGSILLLIGEVEEEKVSAVGRGHRRLISTINREKSLALEKKDIPKTAKDG